MMPKGYWRTKMMAVPAPSGTRLAAAIPQARAADAA
jgi:hypothetical protein